MMLARLTGPLKRRYASGSQPTHFSLSLAPLVMKSVSQMVIRQRHSMLAALVIAYALIMRIMEKFSP